MFILDELKNRFIPDETMLNKVVIYTAIFGEKVKLYPQKKIEGFDFICFSDRPHVAEGWTVRVVPEYTKGDPIRNNRYYKILPHLHLEAYDYSIYIDGNFVVTASPMSLITQMGDTHMLVFDHQQTTKDPRNCIYKEHEAILNLYAQKGVLKDDIETINQQIASFKSKKYPPNNGLIKGGVLIRKHNEPDVVKAMQSWWTYISNFSKRDQLSFNYVAWEQDFKFAYLPGDIRRGNPWFYMVSKADKNLKFSLFKFALRRFFRKNKV